MARGKYADKAAKRQAELAVTNDLASYQHRVAKLTAENRELRERLAAQERAAKQTERRLRAERDEGVAPQVEAVVLQLRAALTKRGEAERAAELWRGRLEKVGERAVAHLMQEHRFSREAASELLLSWLGQGPAPSMVIDGHPDRVSVEARRRIDAARGIGHLATAGTAREAAS